MIGQKHGQRVKVLSNSFIVFKAHGMNSKKQVGKRNVLLVSHGGVMNIILCLENGISYTNKETHYQIRDAEIVQLDI